MHYLSTAKINKARFIIVSYFFEFLIGRQKEPPMICCKERRCHATRVNLLLNLVDGDSVNNLIEIKADILT